MTMLQAVAVLMEQVMAAQALFDLSVAAPAAARNYPLTSAGGASSQKSTSNPHTNNTTNAKPSVRFNASSSTAPNTNSAGSSQPPPASSLQQHWHTAQHAAWHPLDANRQSRRAAPPAPNNWRNTSNHNT